MAKDKEKRKGLSISERDQKLIVVVGTLAIVVVFGWFFLRPLWATHVSLAEESDSVSVQLAQAQDESVAEELLAAAKADDRATVELLQGYSRTLDSAQVDRLTSNMAKRYGFSILNLVISTPDEGATLPAFGSDTGEASESSDSSDSSEGDVEDEAVSQLVGIDRIDVSLTLDGSRSKLQDFINKVEREYPGVHITSFQWIDNADNKSWNLLCEMSVYTRER